MGRRGVRGSTKWRTHFEQGHQNQNWARVLLVAANTHSQRWCVAPLDSLESRAPLQEIHCEAILTAKSLVGQWRLIMSV